jgi:hypothetical protein
LATCNRMTPFWGQLRAETQHVWRDQMLQQRVLRYRHNSVSSCVDMERDFVKI